MKIFHKTVTPLSCISIKIHKIDAMNSTWKQIPSNEKFFEKCMVKQALIYVIVSSLISDNRYQICIPIPDTQSVLAIANPPYRFKMSYIYNQFDLSIPNLLYG